VPSADARVARVDPAFGHSSARVAEWLRRRPADDGEIIAALRGMICEVAADAHEIVYHDALGYGPTDSGFDRILYISVFKDHVNLGLFYGAGLHDPQALLAGSGKQMRHVKIRPGAPLPRAAIRQLLEEAWPAGLVRVQDRHARKR
jgi:hypothetical protein